MKIVAIRGENLASLARPFDIDLAEGPLAQSGLFAITGPTGSGKSTLLDALCLALYDQTPRYTTGRQGASVGAVDGDDKLWLKSNDVRQILSRGKAEGWAEVDFIGTDGDLYRARWSVRRARGRLDGRLQNQEMSLTHLASGKVESGKKTEVLEQIEQRVGLSWEQFRRAVLLAQGDFAAFLKASPKARSELLERLTGTEIYSRIGAAAFERGRRAEQELVRLQEQRQSLELMDDEALAALANQIAGLAAALSRGQQLIADAGKVGELAQQCQAQQQSIEQHAELQAALEAQQPEFDALASELSVFDQAQSARPLYQELSQLDVALAEAAPKLARQREIAQQVDARIEQLELQQPQLQQAQQQAEQQWQQWQGQRGEAEQLSRQRQGVSEELDSLQQRLSPLRQSLASHDAALQELDRELSQLNQQQSQLNEYRQRHGELVALAGQWSAWRNRLLALGRDSEQWHQLRQTLRQLMPELEREQVRLKQLQHRTQELSEHDKTLSEALIALRQQEPQAPDAEALQSQQQQLRQLVRWLELEERLAPARQHCDALERQLTQLQQQQQGWQSQRTELEQRIHSNHSALQEAQAQWQQAQATLSLEQYRPLLQPEQPCPLCGGHDHPYAESAPVVDALLAGMQGRLEQLALALEQDRAALHRGLAVAEQSAAQQQRGQRELAEYQQQLSHWQQEQQGLLADHPEWQGLSAQALQQQGQHLDQALQQGHQQQQQWRHWQQQHQRLQADAEALHQALAEARQQHHQAELALQAGQERQGQLETELTRLQNALKTEQAELAAVLPQLPWAELAQQPAQLPALVEALDHELTQLNQAMSQLDEVAQALQTGQQARQQRELEVREQRANLALLEPKQAELTQLAERLDQALQRILQGEALEARHQRLQLQWQQAQEALQQAQSALHNARTEQAGLRSALTQLEQTQTAQQAQRRECLTRWSALLQTLGLAEQQVLSLMGRDHLWRQQQQQRLSEFQLACESARRDHQRAVDELAQRQAQHQQAQQDWQQRLLDSEFEATDLGGLNTALEALERQHFECRHQQAQQAALRDKAEQLQSQALQAEQDCRVWLQLKEVIGSADGSRFRAMAQALTLGQLLQLANAQLAELAPRYRLQPTPGNGLDLQVVDGDMGEEIRAIESLSGGETFLVSLALALALSALTTGGGRIGSLFIDEGFGTLDPDSLEMALSCLDALQAAGRQVGVISHVQTLVERIGTRVQLSAAGGGTSQLRIIER
ncbi:AAA family ATPase [Ferrimonas balearica]|uniref:AAA family ATPase n=1 Tax=Ferrimonas balearica TaxID=44012 RepID=UPI001F2C0F85|nr:AAA family ATPase [Ferrimonas balearica]MBY6093764.1 AAA family ATPase [Ferrimonas balearica]